jgi:hypothetical protein
VLLDRFALRRHGLAFFSASCHIDWRPMNTIVMIENKATQQSYESKPYPTGTALDISCICGALIHPIVGAWCAKCGAKVVQIRGVG